MGSWPCNVLQMYLIFRGIPTAKPRRNYWVPQVRETPDVCTASEPLAILRIAHRVSPFKNLRRQTSFASSRGPILHAGAVGGVHHLAWTQYGNAVRGGIYHA